MTDLPVDRLLHYRLAAGRTPQSGRAGQVRQRSTCRERSPGTENLLEIKTTLSAVSRVLHGSHAACILIEHVGKPTDNRPARLFCCRLADPDSPEAIGRRQPRRISQSPSTRLGPAATSTEVTGPELRTGPDVEV